MNTNLRVILIGGTSNVGKSTLARHLAAQLGWDNVSTDKLGRYPGRPWATPPDSVKPHVVEHYLTHDDEALVAGQLAHYQNMWPTVETLVRQRAAEPGTARLVLEGSGVWPDNVAALRMPGAAAIWLTGSAELITARIHAESGYAGADAPARHLIDRFVVRSVGYDIEMMAAVRRLGLSYLEVTPETTVEWLADQAFERMGPLD